ncbi:hepatic lectin-like isoform X2 [Procambarus clarkii]|uniref:hepatic lectin-like isoform X2 n=1 Tax=Procambarus clarkii TaxID=6728 RepID=UPI00374411BC
MFVVALLVIGLLTQVEVGTASCTDPFIQLGEGCYYFIEGIETWSSARAICQILGDDVDLAVFDTLPDDYTHIASHILSKGLNFLWVGGTDQNHQDYWTWVDGTPMRLEASYWDPASPRSTSYDCVQLYRVSEVTDRMRLVNISCSATYYFVCQQGVTPAI